MEPFIIAAVAIMLLLVTFTGLILGSMLAALLAPSGGRTRGATGNRKPIHRNVWDEPLDFGLDLSAGHGVGVSYEPDGLLESHSSYLDAGDPHHDVVINPATGLMMLEGIGGIDLVGDIYGRNLASAATEGLSHIYSGFASDMSTFSSMDQGIGSWADSFSSFDHSSVDHAFSGESSAFGSDW